LSYNETAHGRLQITSLEQEICIRSCRVL